MVEHPAPEADLGHHRKSVKGTAMPKRKPTATIYLPQSNKAGQPKIKTGPNSLTPEQRAERKREGDRIRQSIRRANMTPEEKAAKSEYQKQWEANNRERVRDNARKTYNRDIEHSRQMKRKATRKHRELNDDILRERRKTPEHRAKSAHLTAKRRYSKRLATPWWADLEEIQKVYALCAKVTKKTGIAMAVDHIIPISGKNVCGLHVHWNLRIISKSANSVKNNKLEESWGLAPSPATGGVAGATTMDLLYILQVCGWKNI